MLPLNESDTRTTKDPTQRFSSANEIMVDCEAGEGRLSKETWVKEIMLFSESAPTLSKPGTPDTSPSTNRTAVLDLQD